MPVIKKPKILLWNAQGITTIAKQSQLEYCALKENIDIILLVETFLKPNHTFKLNDFIIYRNDRLQRVHGGVAVAVRKSVMHKYRAVYNTQIIENIAIDVMIENEPISIVAAYCPKHSIHFENDIRLLTSSTNQFMVFGDFNARHQSWNCFNNNISGKLLFNLQNSNNFLIYNTPEHTHHPHSGQTPSTIDILLANVSFTFKLSTLNGQLYSDHEPIICDIEEFIPHSSIKSLDYKKADWNNYRRTIDSKMHSLQTPDSIGDIDSAIDIFTQIICESQHEHIPTKTFEPRPNITKDTKHLIQQKNTLKRKWQRTNINPLKDTLKTELNRLQKQINSAIKSDSNNYWNKQLKNISKGGKKLWNLSKQLRGKYETNVDKIKINGATVIGDNDRANCLEKIFEESHNITSNYRHENDMEVRNTVYAFNCFNYMSHHSPNIEIEEINNIVNTLKPFKSSGPDTIQNILIKNLPQSAIKWLTGVLNHCIMLGHWPTSFKIAKVIPILKPGKPPSDPRSYRPISLLNALGKIFEKIIYNQLIDFIEMEKLLPKHQFGFRRGHSTTHQATRIKKFIEHNKHFKKSTGVVLLDIEKAFDSIWHDGLINKLIKMKLPRYLIRIIQAFIKHRQFAVHINGSVSERVQHQSSPLRRRHCIIHDIETIKHNHQTPQQIT